MSVKNKVNKKPNIRALRFFEIRVITTVSAMGGEIRKVSIRIHQDICRDPRYVVLLQVQQRPFLANVPRESRTRRHIGTGNRHHFACGWRWRDEKILSRWVMVSSQAWVRDWRYRRPYEISVCTRMRQRMVGHYLGCSHRQ